MSSDSFNRHYIYHYFLKKKLQQFRISCFCSWCCRGQPPYGKKEVKVLWQQRHKLCLFGYVWTHHHHHAPPVGAGVPTHHHQNPLLSSFLQQQPKTLFLLLIKKVMATPPSSSSPKVQSIFFKM